MFYRRSSLNKYTELLIGKINSYVRYFANALHGLGVIGSPVLMMTSMLAIIFSGIYPLTKKKYAEIRETLDGKV